MNTAINPGDVFSLIRIGSNPESLSKAECFWVCDVNTTKTGLVVVVKKFSWLAGAGIEFTGHVEHIVGNHVICENSHSVTKSPASHVPTETLHIVKAAYGKLSVVGREDMEVRLGEALSVHACESIAMWASEDMVDASSAREEFWFHATTRDDWEDSVLAERNYHGDALLIHAGSRESALARINSGENAERQFYLHTLRLRDESKIYPRVLYDQEEAWDDHHNATMLGNDVFTYYNDYEDEGSISICGRLSAFDVVCSETIRLENIPAIKAARSNNHPSLVLAAA